MKIFAYNSSRNESSKTLQIVHKLIKEIDVEEDNESKIYTPMSMNIEHCVGCVACFNGKSCAMDKRDSFDKVKKEMLESDVVIFASPVYACAVSGDMKVFIDRISHMLHLMALRGKIGIPIISASSNSLIETEDYLKKVFEYLGAYVPFSILCTVDYPKQFGSEEFDMEIKAYARRIKNIYVGKEKKSASKLQDSFFRKMQKNYIFLVGKNYEADYWYNNNMLEYMSYQQLLDDIV